MRTNIEIDDKLLQRAMELSDAKTKKETIEKALQSYVRYLSKLKLSEMSGKVKWEGNLDDMRSI